MIVEQFSKTPRLTARLVFGLLLPIALLGKFFTKNIYGIGILAVILYMYMQGYSSTPPMNLAELLLFFDALSSEMKAAVAASILTVLGFLIVLHSASVSWKGEWLARYNADIATTLESFFDDVLGLLTQMEIDIFTMLKAKQSIQEEGLTQKTEFNALQGMKAAKRYSEDRMKLSELSIESWRFKGLYYQALATFMNAPKLLADATNLLDEANDKMWIIIPYVPAIEEKYAVPFIEQIDPGLYLEAAKQFKESRELIGFSIGGLRGLLLGKLVGFNICSYLNSLGKKSTLSEAIDALEKRKDATK